MKDALNKNGARMKAGPDAQRFALAPPPHAADRPEVADAVDVVFMYERELREPGEHFHLLLAHDARRNEVGRERLAG